jgi:hypothetical protein
MIRKCQTGQAFDASVAGGYFRKRCNSPHRAGRGAGAIARDLKSGRPGFAKARLVQSEKLAGMHLANTSGIYWQYAFFELVDNLPVKLCAHQPEPEIGLGERS